MATELVRQVWCDVCLGDGVKTDVSWSDTVTIGGDAREIDLCGEHADTLVEPLDRVIHTFGRKPLNGPAVVSDRVVCPLCGATYAKRSGLRQHYLTAHPTHRLPPPDSGARVVGPIKPCPVCATPCRGGTGLAAHMRFGHPDVWAKRNDPPEAEALPPFACEFCGQRFSAERAMTAHVRQKHQETVVSGAREAGH